MIMGKRWLLAGACALGLASLSGASAPSASLGGAAEWGAINGDSNETGYSRLATITAANAGRLGLAWSLDLPGEATLEAAPLMVGGMLYFTGSQAKVYAVNAATGRIAWTFDPKTWEHNPEKMHYGFGANRGVAYANGRIFSASQDGRLFALDAVTGKQAWVVETTDPKGTMTISGAPRVFNGKVIIGQGGADFGNRGYVAAYDQATGRQVWKFFVVPGSPEQNKGDPAMEGAGLTWSPDFWKHTGGGGGPWDNITFDAELNRIYIGTANAFEYNSAARDPGNGDNLYTASVVALDADTGKYVWHYQNTPRDSWDFDATQQMMLATLTINGRTRKVLMQAPKNGFFYVIDRGTGELISAGKIGKVNWADHIDLATGRPAEAAGIRYLTNDATIYPSTTGAHSWMRMAMSPKTGLVYVPMMQLGTSFRHGENLPNGLDIGGVNMAATHEPGDNTGSLVAWDPVAQKPRWSVPLPTVWNGGALATAGNVVFQGAGDGTFSAYEATSGKRLWQRQLGMGVIAAPVAYQLGGRQYVAVLAGYGGSAAILSDVMHVGWKYTSPRRLFVFALNGKRALPAAPVRTMAASLQDNPAEVLDPQAVTMGKPIYLACAPCHGAAAVGAGGPAPDLRESAIPLDGQAFWSVVHDGALLSRGMPKFEHFEKAQIEGIRQYIRAKARAGAAQK